MLPGSPNSDPISDYKVLFYNTRFQTRFHYYQAEENIEEHSVTIHLIPFPLNVISLPSSATSVAHSCWFNSIVEFIPLFELACH